MSNQKKLWIETMRYLRETSGSLYTNQIVDFWRGMNYTKSKELLQNVVDPNDIVSFLNNCPYRLNISECLVKSDGNGAIYTNPSARQFYDYLIYRYSDDSYGQYQYNRYLYERKVSRSPRENHYVKDKELLRSPVLSIEEGKIYIDFSKLSRGDTPCIIENFRLEDYILKIISDNKRKLGKGFLNNEEPLIIAGLVANGVIFTGDTNLSLSYGTRKILMMINHMSFNRCTFAGNVYIQNLCFDLKGRSGTGELVGVSFRNARFCNKVEFRDCDIYGDNYGSEISFEDARFCAEELDKGGSLTFSNVKFRHTKVNMFQTVFGDYIVQGTQNTFMKGSRLCIQNSSFGDKSKIICDSMQMRSGEIVFRNIPSLPEVSVCLEPVPYCGMSSKKDISQGGRSQGDSLWTGQRIGLRVYRSRCGWKR
ncbi:MAG: hypothetical protein NC092_08365 [Butyrivibrio sp.]|nr:hypothetical protein [Muribaculum sp.]MCM1552690.1 hypothetical protein [Butyrivibrio sp.]